MRRIEIPKPRMPTSEEVMNNTLANWTAVKPTLLSNLHRQIMSLSIPTRFYPISTDKVMDWIMPLYDGNGDPGLFKTFLEECIEDALHYFPEGVFFKLDSRSPKDAGVFKITHENKDELFHNIQCSMRLMDDFCIQSYHRELFFLCFRKWVDMKDEHRVFVENNEIVGISWYDYTSDIKPEIGRDSVVAVCRSIHNKIDRFVDCSDYVFDVAFTEDGPILIELNPFGLSDPCCFVSYGGMHGEYIGEMGGVRTKI